MGVLQLTGANSQVQMNGASLTASCTGRNAVVLHTNASSDVHFEYPSSGVRAFLGGVALACGTEIGTMDTPCAADGKSGNFPGTFFCVFKTDQIDVGTTGPFKARAEAVKVDENTVGHMVHLDCELPPVTDYISSIRGAGKAALGAKHSLTVSVYHFVKRRASDTLDAKGVLLPYDGLFGGDAIDISVPQPPPPAFPPAPPPPAPPPPPPPAINSKSDHQGCFLRQIRVCFREPSNRQRLCRLHGTRHY